jgi:2-C-methyl-D-erythritol 2,4-cyclodiphosphate synthase
MIRVGIGSDIHRLTPGLPLVLGGVAIDSPAGAEGHSDADALAHAVVDAILGALCEGDIGAHFPDSDPKWAGFNSMEMLARVVWLAKEKGFHVGNLDCIVSLERPKLRPYIPAMREHLANTLGIDAGCVSIKAKSGEGLDAVGEGRAIQVQASVLLESN